MIKKGEPDPSKAEEVRCAIQRRLDGSIPQAKRNRAGQFATPPAIAETMLRLGRELFPSLSPVQFLDPAVGTGAFYSALLKAWGTAAVRSAQGYEVDPRFARVARRLWHPFGLRVRCQDFTAAPAPAADCEKATLVVCNPPYVRHHHLSQDDKARLQRLAARRGLAVNGLAGLYCYFLLLADAWMAENAGAIWIVPGEFLDVNYGRPLKEYLLRRVTTLRIHRYDPDLLQFPDALVTSTVVVFQKASPSPNHRIAFTCGQDLLHPTSTNVLSLRSLDEEGKWGPLFDESKNLTLPKASITLGDLFDVKRGIATGANSFFVLTEEKAAALGLPSEYLTPILPGPRLLQVSEVESGAHGFPSNTRSFVLLDCRLPRSEIAYRYPSLFRYLRSGEEAGVADRYLTRGRSPWYAQENRPPAPILCTYMGRRKEKGSVFRFIRNRSQATATNVYLLLYPRPTLERACRLDPDLLEAIFSYLTTVVEILPRHGRAYGGGLKKVEPRELASIPLPEEFNHVLANDTPILQLGI